MAIPEKILAARLAAGYRTQHALAAALGVSQGDVSRWESGSQTISVHKLIGLSRLVGVSMDWLACAERTETVDEAREHWRLVRDLGYAAIRERVLAPPSGEGSARPTGPLPVVGGVRGGRLQGGALQDQSARHRPSPNPKRRPRSGAGP